MMMDPRFITPANVTGRPFAEIAVNDILSDRCGKDFIDFLATLKEYNCRRLRERKVPGTLPFLTMTGDVVQLFFLVCSSLQLPPEVKYLALEIFDSFTVHHFIELWQHACGISSNRNTRKKYWHRISSRAQKQALLRAATCIQLASKVTLQSKSIGTKSLQQYLTNCGHSYNLNSVYLSEIRVFSTLGCKVPIYSIHDFVLTSLEGLQFFADLDLGQLYSTCEKVLDFTLLQRDEIYLRYFWMGTNRWERNRQERFQFAEIELDNFLMASSVVVSSLYIHHLEGIGPNKASETLSVLCSLNSNDIRGLALIIAQMVLGTRTVSFTSCD